MKAKQRTLIALLAVVLLLAAALWAVNRQNETDAAASSAAEDGTIQLCSFAADDLERISYTYDGETYTLLYSDGTWTLEQDPAYHLDESACSTMRTALCDLKAKRRLTVQDGENYGLSGEEAIAVTVTANGETSSFLFGNENTITGDMYVQKSGDDAVYTVSGDKKSCFAMNKTDLFGTFNPAGLTVSVIDKVTYTLASGESISLEASSVIAESDASDDGESESDSAEYDTVWVLSGNADSDLDQNEVQSVLSALSVYVTAQITDGDPSEYGFDAPLCTAQVTTADGTQMLYYAIGTDGYYLMVEGDDSIYKIGDSVVQLFVAADELKAEE